MPGSFAAERDRLDVAIARAIRRAARAGFDLTRPVFVDETGTTTSMKGCRAGQADANRWLVNLVQGCSTHGVDMVRDGLSAQDHNSSLDQYGAEGEMAGHAR